jgi:hypothetical protein
VLVVPAQVATLRYPGPDGRVALEIPAIEPAGYAGAMRVAAAATPGPRRLATLELLDAGGRVLSRDDDPPTGRPEPRPATPRRVLGRAGAPSLWQTALHVDRESYECLALTDGARPAAGAVCEVSRVMEFALLQASCATHRLTVAVAVPARTRVVVGTGAQPRNVRLRAGLGLLTLAPSARLRSLGTRRRVRPRRAARGPPVRLAQRHGRHGAGRAGARVAPGALRRIARAARTRPDGRSCRARGSRCRARCSGRQ